jgi:hypothetical protein
MIVAAAAGPADALFDRPALGAPGTPDTGQSPWVSQARPTRRPQGTRTLPAKPSRTVGSACGRPRNVGAVELAFSATRRATARSFSFSRCEERRNASNASSGGNLSRSIKMPLACR